jgi:hypothetical protein
VASMLGESVTVPGTYERLGILRWLEVEKPSRGAGGRSWMLQGCVNKGGYYYLVTRPNLGKTNSRNTATLMFGTTPSSNIGIV